MKKKIFGILFLSILVAITFVKINISKDSAYSIVLGNIEALASDESEAPGSLRGYCEDIEGECQITCSDCNATIKGKSGKLGPLVNVKGTCNCGKIYE